MLGATDEGEELALPVKVTMWIVFILATLISQVIMFNTLIAILGDTFSRIMEKRVHHGMKTNAEMYADSCTGCGSLEASTSSPIRNTSTLSGLWMMRKSKSGKVL